MMIIARNRWGFRQDVLRPGTGADANRTTYGELFFDLVFVFAVTQISHILIQQQSAVLLAHSLLLTMTVWWVWIDSIWSINWLAPDLASVRALLIGLMFFGLLMASAIPEAFTSRAVLFACAMTAMQVTCSVFMVFAFARSQPDHAVNFVRITVWHLLAGVFWVGGALLPERLRLGIWLLALILDYLGPRLRFWMPGLGASDIRTWDVSGEHMAERVSLFFIIVFGETVIVTGTAFSQRPLTWLNGVALLAVFVGIVLMWLLYFNHNQRRGSEYFAKALERGLIAQVAYSYVPAVLVIGIVSTAVADELVLTRPLGPTGVWTAGLLCAGSAIYLLGNALFKRSTGGRWLPGHLVAMVAMVATFALHPLVNPLTLSWIVTAVLLIVVGSDEVAARRATR